MGEAWIFSGTTHVSRTLNLIEFHTIFNVNFSDDGWGSDHWNADGSSFCHSHKGSPSIIPLFIFHVSFFVFHFSFFTFHFSFHFSFFLYSFFSYLQKGMQWKFYQHNGPTPTTLNLSLPTSTQILPKFSFYLLWELANREYTFYMKALLSVTQT